MHIQIVNFELTGVDEAEFRRECDQIAPALAAVSWPHLEGKEGAVLRHPHPSPGRAHRALTSACSSDPNMRRGVIGTPG
jgi:hypothetical protein